VGLPHLSRRGCDLDRNTQALDGNRDERHRDVVTAFSGSCRGLAINRLIADGVPVRALPMLMGRMVVILKAPELLGIVAIALRVDMRERCRSAGCHQHQRENR
jgi:hypothetical protein